MSGEVAPEQARAALEWQAEEAAKARTVEAKVAALNEPAPAPALTPEQQAQAEKTAQLEAAAAAALPMLCAFAWGLIDKLAVSQLGPEVKLDADEREQLAGLSVPVVEKYLGGALEFVKTPEGALAVGAAMIYAPKILMPAKRPAGTDTADPSNDRAKAPEGATA